MNKITEKRHMRNGNMDQQQKRSLKALIRYLRMKTWKAKAQPELGLIKINRKGFYSYASRKRKLKESADPLMRWGRQPSDKWCGKDWCVQCLSCLHLCRREPVLVHLRVLVQTGKEVGRSH